MQVDYQKLRAMLVLEEGVRLKPYTDTKGKTTIGVGRNLDDVGISRAEAEFLLTNDIMERVTALPKVLPWVTTLDQVRQTVLVDLSFMGVGALLGFHHMLDALQRGDFEGAAAELLSSKWAYEDVQPSRSQRLATMLRTGEWPSDVK
jgi:lysozyme